MEFSSYDWHQSLIGTADFELASSSELSAILNSLDADTSEGVGPKGAGLLDSPQIGVCEALCANGVEIPDMDPVLSYINDLWMAEEMGVQQSNSQQAADVPPEDLLKEVGILHLPGNSCGNLFPDYASVHEPVDCLFPSILNGTANCDKSEMETWINDIVEVAFQTENQSHLSSPGCSAEVSCVAPGNASPELRFVHDSSLQTLDNILDKAITDSVSDLADGFPELGDYSNNKKTEEAARKLSESGADCGANGTRRATAEAGERGGGVEQGAGSGGQVQKELVELAAKEVVRREAASGGGGARGVEVVAAAGGVEEEEVGRGKKGAVQKKGGGGRRRRGRGQRLRLAEPSVVDLRALLVNCAQAVAALDTSLARKILKDISRNCSPLGNGMQRLAHYFAEGLAARLVGRSSAENFTAASADYQIEAERVLRAYHTFVAVCPFLKLSHFAANDAILNAALGAHRLHILDFNILYGFQWPCFIQALAERAGGPPVLRITAVDMPSRASLPLASPATTASRLAETGRRLANHASLYGVPFEYQIWERHWQHISATSLRLQPGEVLVVNCIHRLRHLMDETMVAPPENPRRALLTLLRRLNPHLFVEGIVNATYNVPFFPSRFREALFHYSSVFDALDATIRSDLEERVVIEREIMGREILNVVACEGMDRLERPETYRQWQLRTQSVGFDLLPLDPIVKRKAQTLVQNFYHKDYAVENDDQGRWLLLGWKGRILHGISTWRPSSCPPS